MKVRRVIYFLLSSITLTIFLTRTVVALTGQQYLSEAKLTLASARQIALKASPGKIVSEELERESGGSGLRYSFVIQQEEVKHEVGVDAKTGQLLENSIEGKNPD